MIRDVCGRGLENGQTLWSWEYRYSKEAYWPGLIWVQINREGAWAAEVATANAEAAVVWSKSCHKSQEADSAACPGLSLLGGGAGPGVQQDCFQEY